MYDLYLYVFVKFFYSQHISALPSYIHLHTQLNRSFNLVRTRANDNRCFFARPKVHECDYCYKRAIIIGSSQLRRAAHNRDADRNVSFRLNNVGGSLFVFLAPRYKVPRPRTAPKTSSSLHLCVFLCISTLPLSLSPPFSTLAHSKQMSRYDSRCRRARARKTERKRRTTPILARFSSPPRDDDGVYVRQMSCKKFALDAKGVWLHSASVYTPE